MLDNFLHRNSVAGVINEPRDLPHQLRCEIWPEVRLGQLRGVEVRNLVGRIKGEDLLHQTRNLGVLDHRLRVPLNCPD